MTYSATDAYSDLTQALDLTTPAEWDEDGREHVSDETDLALAKIQALKDCREALADALFLCNPTELADARNPENVSRRARDECSADDPMTSCRSLLAPSSPHVTPTRWRHGASCDPRFLRARTWRRPAPAPFRFSASRRAHINSR